MDNQCAVCQKSSEQLLVLTCEHDPCPPCAAHQYFKEFQTENDFQLIPNTLDYYKCSICCEITKLDRETINYLKRSHLKKTHKHQSSRHNIGESGKRSNSSNSQKLHYKHVVKTPRQGSTNSSHHRLGEFGSFDGSEDCYSYGHSHRPNLPSCKKHQNAEKTFYCFNCYRNICAECAIHGTHFGHEVQTIKKAGNRIRKIYGTVLSEVQRYDNLLMVQFKEINKLIQQFREWNHTQREKLKINFNQLYEVLAERQQKLEREIDQVERDGLALLENNKSIYEKLSLELKSKKRNFMNALSTDPQEWDIEALQYDKQDLNKIVSEKVNELSTHKAKHGIKYLSIDLVSEAIETIEDLVSTFQLVGVKN